MFNLLQIQFALTGFQLFLFTNVLTNSLLVQAYGAHAIARGPEMQARHLPLEPPLQHSLPVLWYNHHVILALPPNVGQTLPFMHTSVLLPAPRGLPGRRTYHALTDSVHAGSLEALRVTRPEAVV